MWFWLVLVVCVALYVVADAFFDVSKRISMFWRLKAWPWLAWRWTCVWGVTARKAAVSSPPIPTATPPTSSPANRISAGQMLAFLWKAKWLIAIVAAFVLVVGTLRGCAPIWGKSRDELRAEVKDARADAAAAEFEAQLERKAGELALNTERTMNRANAIVAEAQEDIADAVEASDFDRLYDAYARAHGGVFGADGGALSPNPAPSGTSPVRRPGDHTA